MIDKTGLTGEYDWELPYDKANTDVLIRALRERLGLVVLKAKRTIEVLVHYCPVKRSWTNCKFM